MISQSNEDESRACEIRRCYRLAVMEAPILAHVRQIRRNKADALRAEIPACRSREEQGKEFRVRSVERADEHEITTAWVDFEAKIGLTVRKRARFELSRFSAKTGGDPACERLIAGKRNDECRSHLGSIPNTSGLEPA